jgi:hypothetical protein
MQDLMRELKITPQQAAGIVGNFGHESGLISGRQEGTKETDPPLTKATILNHLGGVDWAQWTADRRRAFAKWISDNGRPFPAYKTSLDFVLHELRGSESDALRRLRLTTTAKAAAETFEDAYERAGVKAWPQRVALAERALKLWLESPYNKPAPVPTPVPPVPELSQELIMAIQAIFANPAVMGALFQFISAAVQKAANNPAVPMSPAAAPAVTAEVIRELKALPEVQHVTNTETHWWQQRSKWSAIFGLLTPVVAAVTGYTITPELQEIAVVAIMGVGNAFAAYLAYRAGTAKKPLFVKEPDASDLMLQQMQALSAQVKDLQAKVPAPLPPVT